MAAESDNRSVEAPLGTYHHGELPSVLMQLALQHIDQQGTEKLSLRALAREAGVSATAPYRHFPTKQCLLAALATQGFTQLGEETRQIVESDDDVETRFMNMGKRYIGFAVENPTAYHLMFGSVLADFSEYDALMLASRSCFAQVTRMIREVIEVNNLDYDPVELSGTTWAGVHGIASLLINKPNRDVPVDDPFSPQAALRRLQKDPEMALRMMFSGVIAGWQSGQ